jgi:hypothetical protein
MSAAASHGDADDLAPDAKLRIHGRALTREMIFRR